jgi:hypothetical protein
MFNIIRNIVLTVMSETSIGAYVAEHPKLTGVLFTILLLLSQAGSAAAVVANPGLLGP